LLSQTYVEWLEERYDKTELHKLTIHHPNALLQFNGNDGTALTQE